MSIFLDARANSESVPTLANFGLTYEASDGFSCPQPYISSSALLQCCFRIPCFLVVQVQKVVVGTFHLISFITAQNHIRPVIPVCKEIVLPV